MNAYESLTDIQLIERLREGDTGVMDFLLEKYKYLVRKKANTLFLFGGDTDDLIQEGMIGLFKAIRDFNGENSFFHFAELCISRQMYTAIESAARKKHSPLNSYVSLSEGPNDTEEVPVGGMFAANAHNPEQMLIDRESVDDFWHQLTEILSPLEQEVLEKYLNGSNYRQIAVEMKKSDKSIDNALQRIRKKVQTFLVG